MKTTISEYKRGITSLHNLMDLLYVALLEVMPSAELARVGAYGWRGYVVRSYKNLAPGHFFCQMNNQSPTTLLMEEFCNFGGRMFYPWRVDIDLLQTNFFERDVDGQKAIIVDFYQEAVRNALEWQESAKRRTIVPEKIWNGKKYVTTPNIDYPKAVYRVSREYISAIVQQDNLLSLLREVIENRARALGMPKPFLKYNTVGWKYRGFWMKLRTSEPEDIEPEGSFPYHFKIDLYNHPEILRYQHDGEEKNFDLAENYFFNLDDENQKATVSDFIKPIMEKLK